MSSSKTKRWGIFSAVALALAVYFVIAYVILPGVWKTGEKIKHHRHPVLEAAPKVTHHVGPDMDAERDDLMSALMKADEIAREYQIEGRPFPSCPARCRLFSKMPGQVGREENLSRLAP